MPSVNVTSGVKEDRMMITGMHTVSDIFCVGCGSIVGWKYVRFAKVISQCPLYIALHLTKFLWCSSLGGCTWEEPEIQGRKVYSGEVMAPTFYHSSVALDLFFQNKKKIVLCSNRSVTHFAKCHIDYYIVNLELTHWNKISF